MGVVFVFSEGVGQSQEGSEIECAWASTGPILS